jgi:peptide/nickel transport system substrate-binding protein
VGHRRGCRQEELADLTGRLSCRPSWQKRRIANSVRCGVFICTLQLVLLTACQSNDPDRTVSPLVLTVAVPEGNTGNAELGARLQAVAFTLEGLTQLSVDGRASPKLAERWYWENDGLSLRVVLRPDIRFHDGTLLTAKVAADLLRESIPRSSSLYASLSDVASIRPDGDLELVFDVSRPSALLPEDLEVQLGIGTPAIGTGPYRLVESDTPDIVLERFSDYHLGMPQIERIVLRPFDANRTAWARLLRGDVDMVTDVSPNAMEFMGSHEIQMISFSRRYQFVVAFNLHTAPFDSPSVRRALNFAIDRRTLIDRILRGHAEPSSGPLWPSHWAYDSSVAPYSVDRARAAALLDGAGYKPGAAATRDGFPRARLRFTCMIPSNFAVLERIGLELQRQLFEIGVDLQFETVPIEEYSARIRDGHFEAVLVDMISGPTLGRPYIFWGTAKKGSTGLNVFGYENPEAERLFEIIRTSMNEAAVRSATRRLQQVFLDDPPALFLAWNERARAIRRFNVNQEPGRDPLLSVWQWTPTEARRASTR